VSSTDPRPAYVEVPSGRLHYVEAGTGPPILALHQTPRSWDEFRELIPLVAVRHRVIAMDTIGFGASSPVVGPASIEAYAASAGELLDALGLGEICVLGHHTGGVIAIELAARRPDQVRALVLSSTPFVDGAARRRRASRPAIDEVSLHDDGHHLALLWQQRQVFYPERRPDILTRFVIDALRAGTQAVAGHHAVGAYRMEDRVGAVRARTMLIGASADPYAFPELEVLAEHLPVERVAVVEGGMVPLMELHAPEVASLVLDFLGGSRDQAG
jgi:pimeloyl-ACP methyl ester carboxylesterase